MIRPAMPGTLRSDRMKSATRDAIHTLLETPSHAGGFGLRWDGSHWYTLYDADGGSLTQREMAINEQGGSGLTGTMLDILFDISTSYDREGGADNRVDTAKHLLADACYSKPDDFKSNFSFDVVPRDVPLPKDVIADTILSRVFFRRLVRVVPREKWTEVYDEHDIVIAVLESDESSIVAALHEIGAMLGDIKPITLYRPAEKWSDPDGELDGRQIVISSCRFAPDVTDAETRPEWLRMCIAASGMSQRAAAKRIGVSERIMRQYLADRYAKTAQNAPYPVQYALECLGIDGNSRVRNAGP